MASGPPPPAAATAAEKLAALEDPLAALRANDEFRRPDAGDGDLWTADELAALGPLAYSYPVPTFVPQAWPAPRPTPQAAYSARFRAEFPIAARVLDKVPENLVIAGGAAAFPFGEAAPKAGDVDAFIVGVPPADTDALWRKAGEVLGAFRSAAAESLEAGEFPGQVFGDVVQMLTPGLITLALQLRSVEGRRRDSSVRLMKFQIILRAYRSVSALLHAFDVPAAAVAYDGKTAVTTSCGAFAHRFRVNLVHPAYRSTTYEARLHKYFCRHYALGLVHLRAGAFVRGEPLVLPHATLVPEAVRGNRVAGKLEVPPPAGSDYEPKEVFRYWCGGWTPPSPAGCARYINLAQLASGENRFAVLRRAVSAEKWRDLLPRRRDSPPEWLELPGAAEESPAADEERPGPEDAPAGSAAPPSSGPAALSLAEVFPRDHFENAVANIVRGACDKKLRTRPGVLMKYLGMTPEQVCVFIREVARLLEGRPHRWPDASEALAGFVDRLRARYDEAAAAPLRWWIVDDPGRQYTASLDPRMETPAEWYGETLVQSEPAAPDADLLLVSLRGAVESAQFGSGAAAATVAPVVYGEVCALCFDRHPVGSANSVTLPCGHTFHWTRSDPSGCGGLQRWVSQDHDDCPTCRQSLGDPSSESESGGTEDPPRVQLTLSSWDS